MTVFFILKMHGHGYLNHMVTEATNKRDAIREVKDRVRATYGRNAFHCTTKAPEKTSHGVEFDGMIYTRAYGPVLW